MIVELNPHQMKILKTQAAKAWAVDIVRSMKPGSTEPEVRRHAKQAEDWASVLALLGVDRVPAVNRRALVKKAWIGETWDPVGADAERRRLVRVILGR